MQLKCGARKYGAGKCCGCLKRELPGQKCFMFLPSSNWRGELEMGLMM